jgi:hypothetical protein
MEEDRFKLIIGATVWLVISFLVGIVVLDNIPQGKPVVIYSSMGSCEYSEKIHVPQGGSCISTRQSIGWPTPAGNIVRTVAKDASGKITTTWDDIDHGNWSNAGKNRISTNNALILFALLPILYGIYYFLQVRSGKRPYPYISRS